MIEWILMLGVGLNDRNAEEVTRFESEHECQKAALVISRQIVREELLDAGINVTNPKAVTIEQIKAMSSAVDARCVVAGQMQ